MLRTYPGRAVNRRPEGRPGCARPRTVGRFPWAGAREAASRPGVRRLAGHRRRGGLGRRPEVFRLPVSLVMKPGRRTTGDAMARPGLIGSIGSARESPLRAASRALSFSAARGVPAASSTRSASPTPPVPGAPDAGVPDLEPEHRARGRPHPLEAEDLAGPADVTGGRAAAGGPGIVHDSGATASARRNRAPPMPSRPRPVAGSPAARTAPFRGSPAPLPPENPSPLRGRAARRRPKTPCASAQLDALPRHVGSGAPPTASATARESGHAASAPDLPRDD
jgi:hypothetical protein